MTRAPSRPHRHRDHCQAPEHRDAGTGQRIHDTFQIPLDLAPRALRATPRGELEVAWPPSAADPAGFTSTYSADFLAQHAYHVDGKDVPVPQDPATDKSTRVVWSTAAFRSESAVPRFRFDAVMAEDRAALAWLTAMRDYGFAFVDGTPVTEEATRLICERMGLLRRTLYSDSMWRTEIRPSGNDTAYTSLPLPAHTDGNYWYDPPGVQVFHAIQADADGGGKSLLVDGFAVADRLRARDPEAFHFLATQPLRYFHTDPAFDYRGQHTVFQLDADGDLDRFAFNNDDRDVVRLPFDQVPRFYRHLKSLIATMRDPELEYWTLLKPGDVLFFNNNRVLHGRSGFSARSGRILSGAYISAEDVASTFRTLHARVHAKETIH